MLRRAVLQVLAATAWLAATRAEAASEYPAKTVKILVPYPPGGIADVIARLTAQALAPLLAVPVVIENRGGAGGTLGVELVARAPADGSTLLFGSSSPLSIAPVTESGLRYDPIADFVPVGRVARAPMVVATRAGLPVTNLTQFVATARAQPGRLTYASGATMVEFAFEAVKRTAGVDIVEVPYKGTAPALLDVVAGHVDALLVDVPAVAPHVASGSLRVIANAGHTRSRAFPTVPTLIEQGYPFEFESWQGLLAPSGTLPEVVARLHIALRQAMAAPEFRVALESRGFEPIDEPPAAFATFLKNEIERYRRLAALRKPPAVKG